MRLSEAIRLGAMATEQGHGASSIASDTAPCALGAARLAAGIRGNVDSPVAAYSALALRWPMLDELVAMPIEKTRVLLLMDAIWRLNDWPNFWTREQIADWVQTIEDAQPIEQPEPVSEKVTA
jgi:hypothetical protein